MAHMSDTKMKTPPPDSELLDDWEQMADSGVSPTCPSASLIKLFHSNQLL